MAIAWFNSLQYKPTILDFYQDATCAEAKEAKERLDDLNEEVSHLQKLKDQNPDKFTSVTTVPTFEEQQAGLERDAELRELDAERRELELIAAGLPYPIRYSSKVKRGSSKSQQLVYPPIDCEIREAKFRLEQVHLNPRNLVFHLISATCGPLWVQVCGIPLCLRCLF
jgi:hypothetical protein